MDEDLIRAKIELYRQLHRVSSSGMLSDVELTIFTLLANDVHVKMKLDGKFPNM